MVTQFVGYLAAYRAAEPFTPLVAGLLGAGLTTWVTFAPSFLWIFAFAPWIERLGNAVRIKGGQAAIAAAVVGVVANLAAWFAIHVICTAVEEVRHGPMRIYAPDWPTLDFRAAILTLLACALVFLANWSVVRVLTISAADPTLSAL